jgi:two-component system, chemotaxis family, chemotaxis protein CheY
VAIADTEFFQRHWLFALEWSVDVDIKRARIMVIEDERVMSAFILGTLRRIGILDLFAYEDGAAALREVAKVKPDLILTDIHMQPMGGIDFVRQMRALSNNQISNIPVIFLSADSSKATVGEALPLGVSGYLVKPPSLEALANKIEVALRD